MSVPLKYRAIGDFHEYYSGKRTAPYLTLFVGGNHEASNHLRELYYGGWVAPNIYYMGAASILRFGPLRIAGLSGIWKGFDYRKPHKERLPYSRDTVKSIYHVRELDVSKLLLVKTQVDIGISHDWPRGVEWKGNWQQLFRFKRHFEEDARNGQLGSLAAKWVMDRLRPPHWFAAHLHCKYAAVVRYGEDSSSNTEPKPTISTASDKEPEKVTNIDEIDIDGDDGDSPSVRAGQPFDKVHNENEINLEADEDTDLADTSISTREAPALDSAVLSPESSSVPENVRNELPASFFRQKPEPSVHPSAIDNKTTHFLALDKCLPNRRFLQILEIDPISDSSTPSSSLPYRLCYDREWLAITRAFSSLNPIVSISRSPSTSQT